MPHPHDRPHDPARRLGILGGMGWPSTAAAYRLINEEVSRRRADDGSAELVIISLDFARVHALQAADDWAGAGRLLGEAAARLAGAGADAIMLCTNTMHRVADAIQESSGLPLLHIADATAAAVRAAGVDNVGLLGTRYTMEGDFYVGRLRAHGLDVLVPSPDDRQLVHEIIYGELVAGEVREESRAAYARVMQRLVAAGAQGIIAGCTEIELLVGPSDVAGAWFPTTRLHTLAAVEWLLGGSLPQPPG